MSKFATVNVEIQVLYARETEAAVGRLKSIASSNWKEAEWIHPAAADDEPHLWSLQPTVFNWRTSKYKRQNVNANNPNRTTTRFILMHPPIHLLYSTKYTTHLTECSIHDTERYSPHIYRQLIGIVTASKDRHIFLLIIIYHHDNHTQKDSLSIVHASNNVFDEMLQSVVVFLHRNMKLINLGSPALADKSRDTYASVLPFCKGALKIREWKIHYYLPYSCKNFLYIMQVAWITHSPVRR